jgi:hypothetical protein
METEVLVDQKGEGRTRPESRKDKGDPNCVADDDGDSHKLTTILGTIWSSIWKLQVNRQALTIVMIKTIPLFNQTTNQLAYFSLTHTDISLKTLAGAENSPANRPR